MNNSESFQQTEYKLGLVESKFLYHCQTVDVFSIPAGAEIVWRDLERKL